jgi:hypothetical protein
VNRQIGPSQEVYGVVEVGAPDLRRGRSAQVPEEPLFQASMTEGCGVGFGLPKRSGKLRAPAQRRPFFTFATGPGEGVPGVVEK